MGRMGWGELASAQYKSLRSFSEGPGDNCLTRCVCMCIRWIVQEDMDVVVAIHNNMNENTWRAVLEWESLHQPR